MTEVKDLPAELDAISAQLTSANTTIAKVSGETSTLLAKIDELTAAMANRPLSAEEQRALDGVKAQAQITSDAIAGVDAQVADTTSP